MVNCFINKPFYITLFRSITGDEYSIISCLHFFKCRLTLGAQEGFCPVAHRRAGVGEQFDESKLAALIDQALTETGAQSIRDMGKVMGWLKPHVQGRADMGAISASIKQKLPA